MDRKPSMLVVAVLLMAGAAAMAQEQAYTQKLLHSFPSSAGDGETPGAPVMMDSAGNLYGTTYFGGGYYGTCSNGCGTVFKIDTTGNETVLYMFSGTPDGVNPFGGLVQDGSGNLYGTTLNGGAYGKGTVFKLDAMGIETVLHSFTGGPDGANPFAGLVQDGSGNLYGGTIGGGETGDGTIYRIDVAGNVTVLFSLAGPDAPLILDSAGNLYGARGYVVDVGPCVGGTAFKLDTTGNMTTFGTGSGSPHRAGLVRDASGNLYGTTHCGGAYGSGTVFKIDTAGNESTLYSFAGSPDGANPHAGLVQDAAGNLYGTTYGGGANGNGIVFKINTTGMETILHSFGGVLNTGSCTPGISQASSDGANPEAPLILDAAGNLYGTTCDGGPSASGTVFELQAAGASAAVPPVGVGTDPQTAPAFVSEPVNTGNGNYFYQHTDFTIPGRGMPLVFQRSYNSLDNYSGPLGVNWTHSYNVFGIQTATGVVIKWGDGHGETYTMSGGVYVPQPGVFNTLVQNPDNSFTLTQKNQTRYLFSATGILTNIVDKNGNTISLTYSGGNLTQITDTVGRNLMLTYDAGNRIIQITDPIGRTATFAYTANNDLAQVTDPAGGLTQLVYDGSHHVRSITLPNSQVLLQNTYDAAGRVLTQTNGRGFTTTFAYNTPSPGQTTITDARGKNTVHTYDASLRITTITDALSGVVSYAYDANNDRTSVTNQNGNTTTFAYDGDGNVTGITDPLGDSSGFTYDARNDLLTGTNPKGKTTTFSYDANGNLRTIQDALGDTTTFAYDGMGELGSKTDANGHVTTYGYDSSGNLKQITDAVGDITTLGYDGIGRLTTLTDPNHHTATAAYDALSRLTTVTDPLGHQTQFAYDAVGNLLKITDGNGHATAYAYDAVNNLVTVTDALGHVTQYAYDANNNRMTFANAKGNATSYAYDAVNRLSTITDPLSFVTTYGYDPAGNVTAVKDANGKTNQFAYDALNRLIGISYADGKNVAYAYDADGNRTGMVDSHGTTSYGYDALDRLTSVTNPGGGTVTYGHDAVGNRNSLTYPDGKLVNYVYDAVNRVAGVSDWLGRMTSYSYDPGSNLLAIAYPNKAGIAFAYDAANRLTSVVNSMPSTPQVGIAYTLDAVGNRTKETVAGVATTFGYDPLNELISAQLGPLKTTWSYDAAGNRVNQTSPLGPTSYTYDAADRLLKAGSATFTYDNNGNRISETAGKLTWSYTYDAANRLVKDLGSGVNSTFGYDGDGNRILQTNGGGTYNYLNDLATALPVVLNEQGPDGNITYAYGLGLIEESSFTFNYFYHYDGLGSVIALTDAKGKPQAAYAYDPWGNTLLTVTDSVGTKNKFRFTGEALDPGTGLYYLRARYYDPTVGRFQQRDPFAGFLTSPSQGLNRYIYGGNSPINNVDLTGLWSASTIVDKASAAAIEGVFALGLSGTIYVKGWVDLTAFLSPGQPDLLRLLTATQYDLTQAELAEARVMNAASAVLLGTSLTPEQQQSYAQSVVTTSNFVENALTLLSDIKDVNQLHSIVGSTSFQQGVTALGNFVATITRFLTDAFGSLGNNSACPQ